MENFSYLIAMIISEILLILIETLLGPSVPPRRAYLLQHAEEANDVD